jgi:hypothetical protein
MVVIGRCFKIDAYQTSRASCCCTRNKMLHQTILLYLIYFCACTLDNIFLVTWCSPKEIIKDAESSLYDPEVANTLNTLFDM